MPKKRTRKAKKRKRYAEACKREAEEDERESEEPPRREQKKRKREADDSEREKPSRRRETKQEKKRKREDEEDESESEEPSLPRQTKREIQEKELRSELEKEKKEYRYVLGQYARKGDPTLVKLVGEIEESIAKIRGELKKLDYFPSASRFKGALEYLDKHHYTAAAHQSLMKLLVGFHSDMAISAEQLREAEKLLEVANRIRSTNDSRGLFSKAAHKETPKIEQTFPSFLTSSVLRIADLCGGSNHFVVGQVPCIGAAVEDVAFCAEVKKKGVFPVVMMEGTANSLHLKDDQLFAYCYNALTLVDYETTVLGIIIDTSLNFRLAAYQRLPEVLESKKVAKVDVLEGALSSGADIVRLTQVLVDFTKSFDPDVRTPFVPFRNAVQVGDVVYKLFEKADENWSIQENMLQGSKAFTFNATYVCKYPYVPGSSEASTVKQLRSAVVALKSLHDQNIIHADVRPANMVFGEESCTYIDFEFSGDEKHRYPEGFNLEPRDVKRHNDVKPHAFLHRLHDWYSLASVFRSYKLSSRVQPKHRSAFCKAIQALEVGEVDRALQYLERVSSIKVAFVKKKA